MTTDKQLEAFFDGVVNAFHREYVGFHWPAPECFDRSCARPAVKPIAVTEVLNGCCNWRSVNVLARDFFNHGPEVGGIWESDAMRAGFDPDLLHEIMLGVFIGGDGERTSSPAYVFSDTQDTGMYLTNKTLDIPIPEKP